MSAETPAPKTNFAFLRDEFGGDFYRRALEAERRVFFDPRAACVEARITLEEVVRWLYEISADLTEPYRSDLAARLSEPTFIALVGRTVQEKADLIRRHGNRAAHDGKVRVNERASLAVVRELFHVLYWVARSYGTNREALQDAATFDAALIPRPLSAEERAARRQASIDQLRAAQQAQDEREAELKRALQQSEERQAELERLRAELAAIKAANDARVAPDHEWDEAATRDEQIDVLLLEAGWDPGADGATEVEVDDMPRQRGEGTGKGYVDYVLWGADGKPLGLVEAKRTKRSAQEGQQQAKLYADALERKFGQRPVIFYTNGYDHWLWDDTWYAPRKVAGFYTRAELATLVLRRSAAHPLDEIEINSSIVNRDYQQRAIRRVCEAFEQQQRGALLVMATGSGKTRTVIALVDVLMKAGLVKRALFLADRQALVKQAANAFRTHLPSVTTVNLLDVREREQEGRVFVSTYPTIMNLIDAGAGVERRFGPGAFDLVIVDEAHRSVYQRYGAIFGYFDSLLVGLTATPRDEVHRDTYRVFGIESGVPTDQYGLDEAVDQGHLVPPRAFNVPLKFPREGARYIDLTPEERERWDELEWDDDGLVPDEVTSADVNRTFFNKDTVDKVLEVLMVNGHRVAGGDRLGKTIIFAKNQAHAEFIAERFDANYPEYKGSFARIITHRVEHAQDLIDQFSRKDEPPHIAISVDMLDTGIDVPEVVNLVFFKIVRSSTKFWQMIGRGTRKCPELYGPGADKTDFLVFDICGNLEFFSSKLKEADTALSRPLRQRIFDARVDLIEAIDRHVAEASLAVGDRESDDERGDVPRVDQVPPEEPSDVRELRWGAAHALYGAIDGMNLDNFLVRPHRRKVEEYRERARWSKLGPEDALDLKEQLAPLPTGAVERDEAASRVDLLMLNLQRGTFDPEPADDKRRSQVQQIAGALLEQTSIPAIAAQEETLSELASDEWWVDVTAVMLERARKRIRGLARLIERSQRATVFTDFVDDLGEVKEVPMPGLPGISDFTRFREKTRAFLRAHEDNLTIVKLRRNEPLTETDLKQLRDILLAAGVGSRSDLRRAAEDAKGLGLFIRGLIGMDRPAASAAINEFIAGKTLTADQLTFLDEIVEHLTKNGVVERGLLYDSPFSEIAPGGPEDLFNEAEIIELGAVLDRVRANATGVAAA